MRKVETVGAFLLAAAAVLSLADASSAKRQPPAQEETFKREEFMVMNLNRGPKSAKFYLLDSLKQTRASERNIERAISQVEQADASFAKARRRPDDRTMTGTVQRMKAALQTAQQLEKQLEDAEDELKSDVQQTLISK